MLVIRMQRTGRSGHAQFRVVVQDSRRTPTSGKIVSLIGHYNPHSKETVLDKERAAFYLEHGAQPSERVTRLLQAEGVKLPDWVSLSDQKQRTVRNADKRRSTRPVSPVQTSDEEASAGKPEKPEEPSEEIAEAATEAETSAEVAVEPEATEATEATQETAEEKPEE